MNENLDRLENIDFSINQYLGSIIIDGITLGYIEIEDNKIVTGGFIGNNKYSNWIQLIYGLQGFGIAIDNFYF